MDHLRLRWRTVAVGSLLINLGAIASVALIATVNSADALATVALALAVIAFICQLIVFAIQTWQSAQQLDAAKVLNSETKSMLAETRARIEGTNQMVSTQYQELLHLSALKSASDVAKESISTGEQTEPANANIGDVAAERVATDQVTRPQSPDVARPPSHDEEFIKLARKELSWPEELALATAQLDTFEQLSEGALSAFVIDLNDYLISGLDGSAPGLGLYSIDMPLLELGLVEEITPVTSDGEPQRRVRLSQAGLTYGWLFIAPWPPPSRLEPLRERIWTQRSRLGSSERSKMTKLQQRIFP